MSRSPGWLRADLHVHSYHSGYAGHLKFLRSRDCYSAPEAVYRAAVVRGRQGAAMLHPHPRADDVGHRSQVERAARIEEDHAHTDRETAHAFVHRHAAVGRDIDEELAAQIDGMLDVGLGARVGHVDDTDRVGPVEDAPARVVGRR